MKKTLLFISFAFVAMTPANAQITITSSDVASPLKTVLQRNDTMPTISIGNSGPAQTWNLSALNTHTTDTMYFTYPSWTTGGAQFPSSNLAVKIAVNGQDIVQYADLNSSSLTFLGARISADFGTGQPIVIVQKNTPSEIVLNFPSTYNSTFTNNYVTRSADQVNQNIMGFQVDSIKTVSHVTKSSTCDGWGTVTTPLSGTAINALRFEEIKTAEDTAWAKVAILGWIELQTSSTTTKNYSWWANGIGFPLVTVSVDPITEIAQSATWLPSLPSVGVNEYTSNFEVNVYPNPAQNSINIAAKASEANAIQIYDATGRLVQGMNITNDLTAVDISSLANGMYSYTVIAKDNGIGARGKFSVVK